MRPVVHLSVLALSFALSLTATAQGDLCSSALFVTPGGYTADGPAAGAGASHVDATNADWYAFDPTSTGFITVSSCSDGVTDTRVHAHSGNCATLTALGMDDDGCPMGYPPGNSLLANVPVAPGDIYYVEFDDHWSTAAFDWTLYFHTCQMPMPQFDATDNTITVTWTQPAPGGTFFVEYGPPGFAQGTGTVITGAMGIDGPPVTITGLIEGTTYDVFVWVDCGGETSPMIGAWPATTTGNLLVPNDDYIDAYPLSCGVPVIDSTTLALPDAVADCGTTISAPGVWYSFIGDGSYQSLSTCNAITDYDTKINVYSLVGGPLVCVAGNDDDPFCGTNSYLGFVTSPGTIYYVLVQGYDGQQGSFELTLDCPDCAPPLNVYASPSDVAVYVFWNSVNASSTFSIEVGPDGFVPGSGTLTTGTVGVDGPPALVPGLADSTAYDLYVMEDCGGTPSDAVGPISFTTLSIPPPANTFCTDAVPIACGGSVTGNTENAIISIAPACASTYVVTPGLWYVFTGAGEDVTIGTCNDANYDTMIGVYSGGCAGLTCMAGDDDGAGCSGNTSSVTFFAQPGVEYLVLVHGWEGSVGDFTLSMTCAPACAPAVTNDDCAAAFAIPTQPIGMCTPLQSTNICAYGTPLPNPACDPYANIVDVWFSFNSGGNADHTLLVTAGTADLVNVAVYADCGDLNFITCEMDLAGTLQLNGLDLSTTYYVRVWNGGYDEAGTFAICDEADVDDAIQEGNATDLVIHPNPTTGLVMITGLPLDAREIWIADLQGRIIEIMPASRSINVGALARGTYLLQVTGTSSRVTLRFVKE